MRKSKRRMRNVDDRSPSFRIPRSAFRVLFLCRLRNRGGCGAVGAFGDPLRALLDELVGQLFDLTRGLVEAEVLLDPLPHRPAELAAIGRLADQLADALDVRGDVPAGDRALAAGERGG